MLPWMNGVAINAALLMTQVKHGTMMVLESIPTPLSMIHLEEATDGITAITLE
jgi:hypothetical protein